MLETASSRKAQPVGLDDGGFGCSVTVSILRIQELIPRCDMSRNGSDEGVVFDWQRNILWLPQGNHSVVVLIEEPVELGRDIE